MEPYQPYRNKGTSVGQYFKAIWDTVVSICGGLHITAWRTMIREPKTTIHYPDVDIRTGELRPKEKGLGLLHRLAILLQLVGGNRPLNKQKGYGGRLRSFIANRYRGILNVDMEICTACLACERACPIECIQILVEKDPENPKRRYFARFDIDLAKCMYCGLCSEPCPTGAIYHTKEFESSTPDFPDFVRNYVHPTYNEIYKVKKVKPDTIEV